MKKLLVIASVLFCVIIKAQPPDRFLIKYGGTGVDIGYGVKETYDKQYVIVGSTTSFGQGSSDAYLLLVDSMGQATWQKMFGGTSADVGKKLVINPSDSGFVFTGYTSSISNGGYDVFVVRTDKNGNLIWESHYGGLDWDFGNDLLLSTDGNIIVCGETYSSSYGKKDGLLLKINIENGNLIWRKDFGGAEDDDFQSIQKTSDGNYTIAGNTKSYGDLSGNFWAVKVNTIGDSISSFHFGTSNKSEKCLDFIEDNNNNLIFCGSFDTSFYNTGKNISYLIKTTQNGNFILESKIAGAFTPEDKFNSIVNVAPVNLYFLSRKVNHAPFGIDVQPYLLNYNLIFIETNTYGSYEEDEAYDVITTSDGGFLMVGYTKGFNSYSEDVLLIKLDQSLFDSEVLVNIVKSEPEATKYKAYYNEGIAYFHNAKRNVVTYQVIDINGKEVQSGETSQDFIQLNPNLPKGIYVLRIIEDKTFFKFLKD